MICQSLARLIYEMKGTIFLETDLVKNIRRDKYLMLLLVPGFIYFFIFMYLPMGGLLIAFKDYSVFKGIWNSPWVGMDNFVKAFSSTDFWNVLRNTILISLYKIIFGFPVPIILSLLLNEIKKKAFKRTIQIIIYLPHFISWVVIAGIMQSILSPSFGIAGDIYKLLGMKPINLLASSRHFRSLLVISDIWKGAGWGTIIYLAALSNLAQELYEAAIIDGANRWKQMWYITLPGISGVVILQLILRIGSLMSAGFDQILILQNDLVRPVSDIFDTFMFRRGLQQANYSYSTAVGFFKSVVGLLLILGSDKFAKYIGEEGLL